MEQRIDPNTQPAYAAGTDPAYVPGLTASRTVGTSEADQKKTEEPAPEGAAPDDALVEGVTGGSAADSGSEDAKDGEQEEHEKDEKDEKDERGEKGEKGENGPVFEVSDRRGSITADRDGIRFRLDDQEAEFHWDEVGAVEVKVPRFGRRFTVTVHMSSRRWFNAEVEAAARSSLKAWAEELDVVLDAYFEE
ncbi:hypothetical protein [Streptomyces sp. NBC_00842]|uniref:hypothetical protein n=1 Tax=Streptomyces sp. NBC_00842 TaxID=2975848 RepID=UPI003865AE56|nr:hypothetical protein OH821_32780 [Streptomyces sp. NBC_00842]